ncbi:response regulator transcription factor [Pararhizobium sp. BT-229]|uniref:response regulator transcription factor n=1 Tax=Pararhizobium sp. BT-229 TaxID=2986923 RepID=UPI0021F70F54|nr:response regulator transcription factor [Pararhizobium sp. BT-229]MCV9967068.1 response regulator transcription factor [Pararhizobium sp. BT-229]
MGTDMMLLDGNEHDAAGARRRLEPQRVILILTNSGSISESLIDAVEREFPWVRVEQVDAVGAACTAFGHPVALILVDIALMRKAEAASAELLRMHPHALTAVIEPYDKVLVTSLSDVAVSPLIRSVLPMDLRLDVWLSIIRLLLCGGEYFPPGFMLQAKTGDQKMASSANNGFAQTRTINMAELTTRESQILGMVSHGLQNKLIAAECGLSEHTVKIHLHHIIRKLGVHNRTEAAARFRNLHDSGRGMNES